MSKYSVDLKPTQSRFDNFSEKFISLCYKLFVSARKRSLRRLCFHRCLSVHRGVSAPLHAGIHIPPGPEADSLGRHPPGTVHAGIGHQAASTHPTGMHSCFICFLHLLLAVMGIRLLVVLKFYHLLLFSFFLLKEKSHVGGSLVPLTDFRGHV